VNAVTLPDMPDLLLTGARVVLRWDRPTEPVDLLLRGGRVLGLRPQGAGASHPPDARVVDFGGAVIAPGFADGHVHPVWAGLERRGAAVRAAATVADVQSAVREFAARNPHLSWIEGGSYDPSLAVDGLFDARWLDQACADRPVVLTSSDHHCLWVNSRALELAGIHPGTEVPPGAEIPLTADGRVQGTLREWEAMSLVTRLVPKPSLADRVSALEWATSQLASAGVTWLLDAAVGPSDAAAYLEAAAADRLKVRAGLALRTDPERFDVDQLAEQAALISANSPRDAAGDPWVHSDTVKFFADGVLEAGTAAMLNPYLDQPDNCGKPVWPANDLTAAVALVEGRGLDVHIHAIGDAGIRNALDAIAASPGRRDPRRRPTIAHVQVLHPSDLGRFAQLGVTANVEPLWACWDACQRDLTAPRLGPDRTAQQYPIRSLLDLGTTVSFGTDWPVSAYHALTCAAMAVTRAEPGGEPWVAEQRIRPSEALSAATIGVARQVGARDWGQLVAGNRADLVVLAADPRDTSPPDWSQIEILTRFTAGEQR
jgi:predicted amidohydrolase YtcJ